LVIGPNCEICSFELSTFLQTGDALYNRNRTA
jgi:hypothetical protein